MATPGLKDFGGEATGGHGSPLRRHVDEPDQRRRQPEAAQGSPGLSVIVSRPQPQRWLSYGKTSRKVNLQYDASRPLGSCERLDVREVCAEPADPGSPRSRNW